MFHFIKKWRRRRLRNREIPKEWLPILEKRIPFYKKLPSDLQNRFLDLLKIFAGEKRFTPAGGMEMTDEVRVVISAAAVRLILHLDLSYYDRLKEIVVYPYDYKHPEGKEMVLGEAHHWGTVVLSWPSVLHGLQNPFDGRDTSLHEFAHALDHSSGTFNGAPTLRAHEDYRPWAKVLNHHFERLSAGDREQRKVMDDYGATNPAEFFAVASESFFEKPAQMKKHTPDLYEVLRRFYGFDPAGDGTAAVFDKKE